MPLLLLPIMLIVALAPLAAAAQSLNQPPATRSGAATPEQMREFVVRFEQGIRQGCLQSRPRDIPSPERYCSCYASKLVSQYRPDELAMINRLAAVSRENVDLIALMTAPLTRACRAESLLKLPAGNN